MTLAIALMMGTTVFAQQGGGALRRSKEYRDYLNGRHRRALGQRHSRAARFGRSLRHWQETQGGIIPFALETKSGIPFWGAAFFCLVWMDVTAR